MVHALTGGGAERVAVSWANGLSNLGHNVKLFSTVADQTYITNKNIEIIEKKNLLKHSNRFLPKLIRKVFGPTIRFFQLHKIIRGEKPDVIINVLYSDAYPLLLARLFSKHKFPIIMTDHNAYERPKEAKFKWRQWKNKFIDNRMFDLVTVLTKRDKDILQSAGINNSAVLHNPLFLTPSEQIPEKKNIILAVGRLDAWYVKGFDLLLKAWDNISDSYPDWKVVIVGKGTDAVIKKLQGYVTHNVNSVEFKPYTSDIKKEYQQAAIFVLSSRYEGWGLVAVEAMSQGCATIACDYVGRQAEFITDNFNGLLCQSNDEKEMALQLKVLLNSKDKRIKLGEAAIKSVSPYNEEAVAKHFEKIIENL